ncbi:MAG: extracellular solute-binding protein [Chloroflexota bacterium]
MVAWRVGARSIDRRSFLKSLAVGSATLLAACQSAPAAPAPAKPTEAPAAPAKAAATSGPAVNTAPAAPAAPAWEKQWTDLIDAAKKEGKVIVSGPPTPEVRQALPAKFKERFGVEMEYLGGRTGDLLTRVESERAAGQYTVDAMISGAQSIYTRAYSMKMLDPIPPAIINPEASDPTKWKAGKLWFMDPDNQYILRITNYSSHTLAVNSDQIDPSGIKAWKDLLDPKYKGKISAHDPTVSGAGWPPAAYLLSKLGDEYIRSLYQGQDVGITRDERQISDWLARGTYPISIGIGSNEVETLKKDGFKIHVIKDLPDAPGTVSAGFGLIGLVNRAPNPNAAKLFLNWIAMKEGAELFNQAQVVVSARSDVDSKWAPDYLLPTPGVDYFDSYGWDWTINGFKPEELERMKRLTIKA